MINILASIEHLKLGSFPRRVWKEEITNIHLLIHSHFVARGGGETISVQGLPA